jgi:membrane protein implicated in regulation of membrane protease activity
LSNLNRIISTALKPGNEYVKAVITRLIIFAAVLFVSTILIIIGLGFLVWSSFLYLSTSLNPYVAALISGLIAILFAGVLFVIVSAFTKASGDKKSKENQDKAPKFVDTSKVVEEYPLESGLMAMAAGFIAGSSPESKKVLTELFVTLSKNSSE